MIPPSDQRPEDGAELTPRERAHLRSRDRKRVTRMVMDNAAVRRLVLLRGQKKAAPPRDEDAGRR
ncbi:MAG: hypothetical protein E6J14_01285 [Chloroflexi bacterium]|nr:MAG: hypothetical protein E6J14_01285 [Chloroflexota bacterium]